MQVKIKRLVGPAYQLHAAVAKLATVLNDRLCLVFEHRGARFAMLTHIPTGVPPVRQRSRTLRASLL